MKAITKYRATGSSAESGSSATGQILQPEIALSEGAGGFIPLKNGRKIRAFRPGSLSGLRAWVVRPLLFAVAAMCILSPSGVRAASAMASDDAAPDTAQKAESLAARLSSVEGSVRVIQDGQLIADPATANLPLFEGSQIATGDDGRAEIQLEDGSVARLSPNSTLTFSVLQQEGTGSRTDLVLNGGLAYFELQPSTAEHSLRVSYGSASFTASSASVVRVTLDTPPGDLAVFSGNVHLEKGDALQLDIHGGESLSLDASDSSGYNVNESIEPDSWDNWNADRDQALNSEAGQKTAADANSPAAGMADLDANGSWYDVPDQGYVWSPFDAQSEGAAWDPYGFGQWVYYPRFGYVWVSGYGWGYTPYQCGLWNYYDNFGWGWAPGGGCSPWWHGGGWGFRLGNRPHGYLPPHRPIPGPGHPHPAGGRSTLAASTIHVDRRQFGGAEQSLYAHPTQSMVIGGRTVEPLRPLTPRQPYDRPAQGFVGRPAPGYYPGSPATRYGYPAAPGGRPSSPSASRPAPAYRPAPSGGGGGGGGRPSGGGGGGGGGGHPTGGGGGTHK